MIVSFGLISQLCAGQQCSLWQLHFSALKCKLNPVARSLTQCDTQALMLTHAHARQTLRAVHHWHQKP